MSKFGVLNIFLFARPPGSRDIASFENITMSTFQSELDQMLSNPEPDHKIEGDVSFTADELIPVLKLSYKVWLTSDMAQRRFEMLKSAPTTSKSTTKAVQFRNLGNEKFKRNRDHEALELYTKSIAFAGDRSEELALAYANRSAVLIRTSQYVPCLLDINRALEGKYPENLRQKLLDRKKQCLAHIEAASENGKPLADKPIRGDETDPATVYNLNTGNAWQSICDFQNRLLPNASEKIKLSYNEQWGRFVTATADIEPGEILSSQEFFSVQLYSNVQYTKCAYCLALCYALIPCPSCTGMLYCSRQCLTEADRAYHRTECKMFILAQIAGIEEEFFTSVQLLALRTLLIGTKQGVELKRLMEQLTIQEIFEERSNPTDKPFVNDYLSVLRLCRCYKSSLEKSKQVLGAFDTIMMLRYYGFFKTDTNCQSDRALGRLTEMELFATMLWLNHLVAMDTYSFRIAGFDNLSLNSDSETVIGRGLCTLHSLFNHSCDPNATYCTPYSDQKQMLVALRPIKKNEQIFVSYHSMFSSVPKTTRNQVLSSSYGFNCQCEACVNEWPVSDVLFELKNEFLIKNWKESAGTYWSENVSLLVDRDTAELSNLEILQIVSNHCKWLHTIIKKPSAVLVTCENLLISVFASLGANPKQVRDMTDPFKSRQLVVPFLLGSTKKILEQN